MSALVVSAETYAWRGLMVDEGPKGPLSADIATGGTDLSGATVYVGTEKAPIAKETKALKIAQVESLLPLTTWYYSGKWEIVDATWPGVKMESFLNEAALASDPALEEEYQTFMRVYFENKQKMALAAQADSFESRVVFSLPASALKGTAMDNTVLNKQNWRGMHAEGGFFERLNDRVRCLDRSLGQMTVPTEAQWEYACRAGTTTPWFFGAEVSKAILQQYAAAWGDSTLTVGTKLPNPWGLYDMYGMMFDTVLDYLPGSKVTYPEGDEEHPVVDPVNDTPSAVGNTSRVSRGGASWDDAHCCRSAYRGYLNSDTYNSSFRLCFTVEPTPSAE